MILLHNILKWTETLPGWQRDAARRLFQKEEGLSEGDYAELFTLLKVAHGLPNTDELKTVPFAAEHLPAEITPGETVIIKAMRGLMNVNRIAPDQTLPFAETGITVIYGGNGSGKSGYARVMKRACRARDQSERVHPNANNPATADAIPMAKFDIEVAGETEEVSWNRDDASPEKLSKIAVFDSRCARSYLTAENDVAYLPYGLDIVESLANKVLPELTQRLDEQIAGIDINRRPFEYLQGDTKVGKQIEGLSAKSNAEAIKTLGTLSELEIERLEALNKALSEADPMAKAKELSLSASRLKELGNKVVKPLVWVSAEAIEKLKTLDDAKSAAETAEKRAAEVLQAGESLLPGTGEQTWKVLFDAAKKYSTEVAYLEHEFPHVVNGAVCPLCQEPIEEVAGQRLQRFEQYIKDDVAKTAKDEREKLKTAKEKIENAELGIGLDVTIAEEIRLLDEALPPIATAFKESIETRREGMLAALNSHDWSVVNSLTENPRKKIRSLAAHQLSASRTFTRAADEGKIQNLTDERNELLARQNLSKALEPVLDLLQRMKDSLTLEACKKDLRTKSISDKSKEFASKAVTKELKSALDAEFTSLGIGHIKTKLKERNSRGRMLHQLFLDLPINHKLDEILSEGEQRAIALGSFLAELSLANHSCGIVFDDPVSSLDHWRRRDVAKRMVAEAANRQVIVFTHDTSFLGQLCDEIDAAGLPNLKMFLEWRGDCPGHVNDGLPWDHQGYKARINALEQAQSKLAKTWPAYPGEEQVAEIRQQYDRLRATLERVIQDVVFNGVVKRYRDWIKVDSLADVVGFEHSEFEAIEKLHKRCCDVITAHDPSSAKAASVPSATNLNDDIEVLKGLVEAIKLRRKTAKNTT
jgi:ABC-type dipeptide/oligopeptide/nickel transport system ATPase subunit